MIHRTGGSVATTVELARLPFVGDTELQWADLGARKVLNTAARGTANLLTGELVVTDGTSGGTGFLNLPAVPATFGSLTPFRGGLLFTAPVDEYTAGLYRTEGLTTILLRTYPANSARGFGVAGNSRAIIVPESADWQQAGVLTTDGTPEGTQALSLATDASRPSTIAALGDTFILSAGQNGFDEVDLNSFDGVDPSYLARNAELFRISPAGAVTLLKEIRSGSSLGSYPWFLTRVGEGVCFFAHSAPDGLAMWENYSTGLWKTDGTPAGTTFIEPVEPPATGFGPPAEALRPGVLGSRFFFGGTSKLLKTGIELWKSDGSAMGTVHLKNIYPGTYWDEQSYFFGTAPVAVPSSSDPAEFTAVGNTLFFAATSPLGRELWKTDGTAAGTVLVKDLSTGDEESPALPGDVLSWMYAMFGGGDGTYPATAPARNVTNPTNLVAVAGKLYFVARDNEGTKLFRSDGTAAGTVPIEGLRSGFSRPRELIAANDRLYYVRGPLALKAQLWEYDPATETHRAVTSLAGGVVNPARLTVADGRIYFVGDDGEGQKLLAYERVPLIREHPATQTLLAGGSTTLEIVPGVPGLAHAWRRGLGFALPVGSDPTLVVPASSVTAQPYSVRVTSTDGRVQNSQLAFLNVLDPATSQNIQRFPDSWWTKEPAPRPNPTPSPSPAPWTRPGAPATWSTGHRADHCVVRWEGSGGRHVQ
ncbi:MAG: hypothetical protein M5U12_05600 [Verrucomicrobia bacterium]|nr:hypothetical protein [Verrucomicrobiota bacterium]